MKNNKANASARTFIVPVGLSVILNYKKEKKRQNIDEDDLLNYLLNNYHMNIDLTSAEIKTLKLLHFNPGSDTVYLLTTDTLEGKEAGKYIESFLIEKLKTPAKNVINTSITGLQVKDGKRFLAEGARNLIDKIKQIKEENVSKSDCTIISAGGFKSILPILSDAGKKFRLNLTYVFESENEIIQLPHNRDQFYESLKEPHYDTLAKELIKARFKNFEISEKCHPYDFSQVPHDTLHRDEFNKTGGLESYKALYYFKPPDIENGTKNNDHPYVMGNRFIRIDTLKKIIGDEIKIKTKLENHDAVYLPLEPGMLFIICLVEFSAEMGIDKIKLDWRHQKRQEIVILEMKLKDPTRFKNGIITGGSKGIKHFRHLVSCRNAAVLKHVNEEQKEEILFNWPPHPLPPGNQGNSPIYPQILKWEIHETNGKLKFWWPSNKKSYPPLRLSSTELPQKLDTITGNKTGEKRHPSMITSSHPETTKIIKSFCGGSRGVVFSKRTPLAAGGKKEISWQTKNRSFRHDWLQLFLVEINAFIETGCQDFSILEHRFPQWDTEKRSEAKWLIYHFDMKNQANESKKNKWLHEAREAFKEADLIYRKTLSQPPGNFPALKEKFQHLSEALRNLEECE